MGWNSALANSLVLLFIGFDLMREIIEGRLFSITGVKTTSVIMLVLFSLVLVITNFYHWLPERIMYGV